MVCAVCRMEYLTVHNCPGPAALPGSDGISPPSGFALFYYLHQAWRILVWDDAAIRRVAADSRALPYGLFVWTLVNFLIYAATFAALKAAGTSLYWEKVGIAFTVATFTAFIHLGTFHLFSKWFFAGEGHFLSLLRPLLLASMVYLLLFVPFLGPIAAGLAWTAVVMMVAQEVHGMQPLSAFLLSAGIGITVRFLNTYFPGDLLHQMRHP